MFLDHPDDSRYVGIDFGDYFGQALREQAQIDLVLLCRHGVLHHHELSESCELHRTATVVVVRFGLPILRGKIYGSGF
jgi:hypothetical protein